MKNSTIGTFVIIAIAAVMIAVVVIFRSTAIEAVYPAERAAVWARRTVWTRVKGVFTGPSSAAEAARLRREVALLKMQSEEMERLARENASLRRALDYSAREPEQWIAAPLLTDHGGAVGSEHCVRVARGSADGVVEGAIASSPNGLVGIVARVTPHTSRVMLLTDPSLKVACAIELPGGRKASGILSGGDRERLLLAHIRGLAADLPRARVTTSGRGGVFPKGIFVGTLVGAAAQASGEWSGAVQPEVDFDDLEEVFIRRER